MPDRRFYSVIRRKCPVYTIAFDVERGVRCRVSTAPLWQRDLRVALTVCAQAASCPLGLSQETAHATGWSPAGQTIPGNTA